MKEYMFYIRNDKDAKKSLTGDRHFEFIKKCETYIGKLKSKSQLIASQPLVREGKVLNKSGNDWKTRDLPTEEGTQVGYYHIVARDMEEAIEIAKENPEFEFVPSASIEIRPVKTKEAETGFVYPNK